MANQRKKGDLTCFPDDTLTKEKLEAFFEDFRSSPPTQEGSEASTFSHLVNNIRQVYTTDLLNLQREILGLQREIIRRSDEHQKQISELKQHYEGCLKLATHDKVPASRTPPVSTEGALPRGWRAGEVLPANTVDVHVGTALGPRRDMLGWDTHKQEKWGWTERYVFKAFKFLEVGTTKITILDSATGNHRANAILPTDFIPEGWAGERIHFYAFVSWRPNTEMISVGFAESPARCIFARGDHANKLEGWSEKFVFWVPV